MANTRDGRLEDFDTDSYFREEEEMDKSNVVEERRLYEPRSHYYIPPQDDTVYRTKQAINNMQEILRPTLDQLNHDSTVAEVSNRVYHRMLPFVEEYNVCVENALDFHDYRKCSNRMVKGFEVDGLNFAKQLAREY